MRLNVLVVAVVTMGGCKVFLILDQVLQLSGPHSESLIGSQVASLGARDCQLSSFSFFSF
jgi:hypothetical protein